MSTELAEHFIIIKGYIDAKDEQQRPAYGCFMSIVSRRDMRYLRIAFSTEAVPKDSDYDELHALFERHEKSESPPAFARNQEELRKFFEVSRTLQGIARNLNVKHAEQTISRFCAEELQLKAVTFVEFVEASDAYIAHFLPPVESAAASAPPREAGEPAQPGDADSKEEERRDSRDIVVRCEPVLDPVRGIAMSELAPGSYVCAKLPEDSAFYKLFAKNLPGFDGIVNSQVTGVLVNELGTATVSLQLAEGVSGVMKMGGKVRIRMASESNDVRAEKKKPFSLNALPVEFVFGLAGIFVLLSIVWLIMYLSE